MEQGKPLPEFRKSGADSRKGSKLSQRSHSQQHRRMKAAPPQRKSVISVASIQAEEVSKEKDSSEPEFKSAAHTAKELKKEDGNNSELPTKDPKIKHENASKDSKKSSGNNGTSRDRATKKTPLESKKDPEIDKGATVVVTKLRHFDD